MTYGKITSTQGIQLMPNPIRITFSNPTDEQKVLIAKLDSWLVVKETEQPSYDPETQYLEVTYVQDGSVEPTTQIPYAVQVWTVHDIEEVTNEIESE